MNGLLRGFRDLSLRKKLILSYCAVIIIPLCLLGAYAYGSANQDLKRQLRVSSAATADQLASELAYRFERQEYPIKSIVFNPKVVSAVSDTDKDVYELAVELNEDVEPIFWNYLFFMSEMKEIAIYSERRNTPFGNFFQPASLVRGQPWYVETGTSTATRWWSDGSTLFATRNIYEPGNGGAAGHAVHSLRLRAHGRRSGEQDQRRRRRRAEGPRRRHRLFLAEGGDGSVAGRFPPHGPDHSADGLDAVLLCRDRTYRRRHGEHYPGDRRHDSAMHGGAVGHHRAVLPHAAARTQQAERSHEAGGGGRIGSRRIGRFQGRDRTADEPLRTYAEADQPADRGVVRQPDRQKRGGADCPAGADQSALFCTIPCR
ncbi:hypothetical protein OMP40_37435 [Cohnella rhizosphaerae]|uniref:Uncharacterized protein n=1 Tax=Cohnella rhizosphaerae TaxID=1457232 RepID=A0A9X4QX85_9BACL|nr:hypothetical protein [Cohnella rhizosphaerae]MDG0814333.1 hypothetical protein [Cohnella rhizosphaerae]